MRSILFSGVTLAALTLAVAAPSHAQIFSPTNGGDNYNAATGKNSVAVQNVKTEGSQNEQSIKKDSKWSNQTNNFGKDDHHGKGNGYSWNGNDGHGKGGYGEGNGKSGWNYGSNGWNNRGMGDSHTVYGSNAGGFGRR